MKTWARLMVLIAPYWKSMLLATALSFLTVASGIGLMATSAYLIAGAALHPPVLELMEAIVGVRFFGISRAVFRYLERYFAHDATFRVLSRLRVWFYTALEPLAPARLMEYRSGELVSRIVADVGTLEQFYLRVLAPPLVALLVLLAVFAFLAWFELRLALTLLFFFLTAAVAVPLGVRALSRGTGRRMVETRSALNAQMVDTIQGMTEIAAFNRAGRQQEQVKALSGKFMDLQGRVAGIRGLSAALTGLLMNLTMWSILLLAIPLVQQGKLDGVYLAMLALGALSSFEAVLPLPMVFQHLEESLAAARRLFAVTDAAPAVQELPGPSPEPRSYDLRVSGLRFRYAPDEPRVLDGVNFVLPGGGRLAIVGPSGAGKSTLVNLFLRFWDYQEGSISLGGHELKAFSPDDLRRYISVVTQHTYLFNATVRENLLLAQPGAGEKELPRAAREAQIHEFIQSLPRGYDTYVGEKGYKLSGGQCQRLAIARALLKNAPVLLLDEATAGLDPVTELEVMESIHRLMEGRTTLVITHRLTGLERMDEILVFERGRIVERGRHRDLLKRGGLYRSMWELQNPV
ncbi:ATP-binding cassette, subfamily C, CydC [Desulfotomaculum arcticum]|uniref:ATP-binding cassette, subfamily C, CydC n=1 Tax=Desulfotruncus arcticus DSM 17038 TaxID=1121424 RepID=A0A1I2ZU04_9FIRM|nr:thiol reductant ABC exporter subunit CydC [Desulfotruncus arcticus]SFH41278.1 ATP-binding cassette, subfamily C, CydC [Desulfotomaculum arcticum] [Desulfotruncus arcticus DSM 17038]